MGSIAEIIADLNFGRDTLLKSMEGLSRREKTVMEVYPTTAGRGWTIKDILAHVIGWDERAANNLPLILANRADEIQSINAAEYNQQMVELWHDKSFNEVLAEVKSSHQKVLDIMARLEHKEMDMRRERQGRILTIRSYVIDMIMEHDRHHAIDIEQWRKTMEQQIDPEAIQKTFHQSYEAFMQLIESLSEAELTQKRTIDKWSIKDMLGHIGDWNRLMLQAAEHIYDPSLPEAMMLGNSIEEQNKMMASRREMNPLSMELRYVRNLQKDWATFMAKLTPADWRLRGAFPWPDQGNIAELALDAAGHYTEHFETITAWKNKTA